MQWTVGVTVYVMLSGILPFFEPDDSGEEEVWAPDQVEWPSSIAAHDCLCASVSLPLCLCLSVSSLRCGAFQSSWGHQILLPPIDWCPHLFRDAGQVEAEGLFIDGGKYNGRTVRLPQPGKKTPTMSHKPAIDRFVPTHRSIVGVFSSRSGTGFRTRPGTSSVRYWWSIRRAG